MDRDGCERRGRKWGNSFRRREDVASNQVRDETAAVVYTNLHPSQSTWTAATALLTARCCKGTFFFRSPPPPPLLRRFLLSLQMKQQRQNSLHEPFFRAVSLISANHGTGFETLSFCCVFFLFLSSSQVFLVSSRDKIKGGERGDLFLWLWFVISERSSLCLSLFRSTYATLSRWPFTGPTHTRNTFGEPVLRHFWHLLPMR